MKKILVIKIGTSVLLTKQHTFDEFRITHLAEQIVALAQKGSGVVLVVSGAVAYGSHFIDLSKRDLHHRQAAAGIGKIHLMGTLARIFQTLGIQIAQMLLTKADLVTSQQAIKRLLTFYTTEAIIPVINENDVLDLNSFGGNDLLAAEIAKLLPAEKMIILSTMQGSVYGVGGGATKQQAIAQLREHNIAAEIVNGKQKNVLLEGI